MSELSLLFLCLTYPWVGCIPILVLLLLSGWALGNPAPAQIQWLQSPRWVLRPVTTPLPWAFSFSLLLPSTAQTGWLYLREKVGQCLTPSLSPQPSPPPPSVLPVLPGWLLPAGVSFMPLGCWCQVLQATLIPSLTCLSLHTAPFYHNAPMQCSSPLT